MGSDAAGISFLPNCHECVRTGSTCVFHDCNGLNKTSRLGVFQIMTILTNLFGESPFGVLEAHGEKVHECVRLLRDVFAALKAGNQARLRELAEQISKLETEADDLRNHLHEMVAAKVLLPMRKEDLLGILEHQDSMADRAEEIAFMLTYRDLTLAEPLINLVLGYVEKVLGNCELAAGVMSRMDLLVESSFKGRDALTVSRLITELAQREDQVKPEQVDLTRRLLAADPPIPPLEALLWVKILSFLGELSKAADRTGHGVRMTLHVKETK